MEKLRLESPKNSGRNYWKAIPEKHREILEVISFKFWNKFLKESSGTFWKHIGKTSVRNH